VARKKNPFKKRVIIVDSREASRASDVCSKLRGRLDVQKEYLESADYVLSKSGKMKGSIGIERKSVEDFISSISDGRLFRQAKLLCDTYEYAVLLIEGSTYPIFSDPIALGAYTSLVFSFSKLKVVWCRDTKETAKFLVSASRYLGPTGTRKPEVKAKSDLPKDIKLAMLCTVRGIGYRKAEKLLKEIPDLFKSQRERDKLIKKICGIQGFNRRLAEKLASVFC